MPQVKVNQMKSEQAGSEHQNKPAGGWCKGSARKVQAIKDRQIRKLQEIHFFLMNTDPLLYFHSPPFYCL